MHSRAGRNKVVFSALKLACNSLRCIALVLLATVLPISTYGQDQVQLNQNCVVSVLNRNAKVAVEGSW